ncbi:uncharacterized protein LOC133193423 [Saccostrea echinata]|uniref:uncharacterized protein LOC133193423 n=1 Tax=Saccostrea echinata TaxID=191078 RepID=UPI002A82117A|nr:uncharacterized protein LOC133193423 [Saccostrea echinata]
MATNSEREGDGEENLDIRLRQDEEMEFFTELALHEAERWISAVTRKKFSHPDDFRKSLENGVLLCELLNNLKPGSVKRINKLPGPIAGLDNINVFLKSCRDTLGLGSNQLFDIGDLEDLSQRAIADSDNLKQEVDRRSLNVAITIFWLGRSVSQTYSGPQLDQSAFSAIVRYSGKDLLPKERHRNDSVDSSDQTSSAYSSHDTNSRVSNEDLLENKHIRDSSCDSVVSKESTPSLDLEDESMPSSVTSKMRRYNSAGSLNTSGGYHFSATQNSINVDDHGHTNSNHHRRGSSTDSMDSSSYLGNHSRQSSDSASVDIPTRTLKSQRKASSSTLDPLQFVKSKGADKLAKEAQEQIEAAKETKLMSRSVIPEKDDVDWQSTTDDLGDWQSNLSSWKNRRRRASSAAYQRVDETDKLAQEEEEKRKPKTYSEMMSERKKRMSTGTLNFYPLDDDDNDFLSKKSEPVEDVIQKRELIRQETAPSVRLQQRLSLKNRANSVGSDKASYEEKEVADWAKDDDEQDQGSKHEGLDKKSVEDQTSAPRNTHDDKFNRGKVSENKKSFSSDSSWRTQSKQDSSAAKKSEDNKSSVSKIGNILKSFEKKEQVDYEKPKKKFEFSVEAGRTRSKWQELEKKETNSPQPVKLSDRPVAKSHPAKAFTEKNIKINLQKPQNTSRGFGFSISGGVEKKQPVTVYKVTIGSAADVCDLQMKDIILSMNRRDISSMTLPQVQHIIDNAVRHGQLELKIKREIGDDDDIEDEAFEETPANSQNHSPIWKSPALAPKTHSPKTSTSPATSPSYLQRHKDKSTHDHHTTANSPSYHHGHAKKSDLEHHRHSEKSTPEHIAHRHHEKSTQEHHRHHEKSTPEHHRHHEKSTPEHHRHSDRSTSDHIRHDERSTPEHHRHTERSTFEYSRKEEKPESSPSYYQRHHDTAVSSKKTEKVPPPVPVKRTVAQREEAKEEVVFSTKWESPHQEPQKEEPKSVEDEPMWIMDKLKAEHKPAKDSPILDTRQSETNNNDVKQESSSESESDVEEEETPVSEEIREEKSPQIETEVVQRPTITLKKHKEPEIVEPEPPVVPNSSFLQESPPPPPPSEAPPPLKPSNLDEDLFKPPDILRRWQRSRSGRSSSSNSLDSDADKRLSSSSLHAEASSIKVKSQSFQNLCGKFDSNDVNVQKKPPVPEKPSQSILMSEVRSFCPSSLRPAGISPEGVKNRSSIMTKKHVPSRSMSESDAIPSHLQPTRCRSPVTEGNNSKVRSAISQESVKTFSGDKQHQTDSKNVRDIKNMGAMSDKYLEASLTLSRNSSQNNKEPSKNKWNSSFAMTHFTSNSGEKTNLSRQKSSSATNLAQQFHSGTGQLRRHLSQEDGIDQPGRLIKTRDIYLKPDKPEESKTKNLNLNDTKINQKTTQKDPSGNGKNPRIMVNKYGIQSGNKGNTLDSFRTKRIVSDRTEVRMPRRGTPVMKKWPSEGSYLVDMDLDVDSEPEVDLRTDKSLTSMFPWQTELGRKASFKATKNFKNTVTAQINRVSRDFSSDEAESSVTSSVEDHSKTGSSGDSIKFGIRSRPKQENGLNAHSRSTSFPILPPEDSHFVQDQVGFDVKLRKITEELERVRQEMLEKTVGKFNINQANSSHVEIEPSKETRYDATVGQPVTLQISTATSQLIIDPRNQVNEEEPAPLQEYSFHVNLDQPKEKGSVHPVRDLHHDQQQSQEEEEVERRMKEKEEQLKKQEEEIRKEREKLRLEQERVRREREALERQKQEEEKSKHRSAYETKGEVNGYDKPSDNVTQFSVSQETNQGPRRLETLWAPDPNKDKQRWSREDMLAMNRKPTPLQKKPEAEPETESSKEVHSNSVPKSRQHSSDYNPTQTRPHRSEHNTHSHWMVEEAERRRRADNKRHSVHSYGGPIKPVHQEGLANRWRDDTSIPKQQTYTTNSVISPRSLNTKQFSAVNEPDKLSQTLPANYSYGHGPKTDTSVRLSRGSPTPPSPSSPPSHAEQIMAVSGKQLCSHCAQELGFGAAMVIESLGLYYHVQCFRCCVCHTTLGNGSQGADVRVRVNKLHCRNCYSNDEAGLKFSKV